jgi:metal-responsive CopG/Arc/MetJ family transcriptional regulator
MNPKRKEDPQRSPENMVLAVSFPRELAERLDRVCEAEDITRSQIVRKLVSKYLEDRESGRNTFVL